MAWDLDEELKLFGVSDTKYNLDNELKLFGLDSPSQPTPQPPKRPPHIGYAGSGYANIADDLPEVSSNGYAGSGIKYDTYNSDKSYQGAGYAQANTHKGDDGYIDNIKKGILSGVGNVSGGIASIAHADDIADNLKKMAEENARTKNYDTVFSMDYVKDPQGLTYDVSNQIGSMATLAPAAFLAPEALVAGGANLAGSSLARMGLGKAAQWAATEGGKKALQLGTRGAFTAVPESLSEGGNVRSEAIESGLSNPDQRAWETAGKNMLTLPLSNALEYMLLGGKIFKPSAKLGESFIEKAAKAPIRSAPAVTANAMQNGAEELLQQTYQDQALGKEVGNPFTPWEWTPAQRQAFEVGMAGSMVLGGVASGTRAMQVNNDTPVNISQEIEEAPQVDSNFNGLQNQAWGEAQWVSEQTGVPAEFVYRQWAHESGNFTSQLSRENNNFGGLTQVEPNGEENKQPDGGNYYKQYGNMHEYAQDYINSFLRHYDGVGNVKSVEEFAQVLKDNGYYGDSVENYINGLKGMDVPGGTGIRGDYSKAQSYDNLDSEDVEFDSAKDYLWNIVDSNDPNMDTAFGALNGDADIYETAINLGYKPAQKETTTKENDETVHHSDLLDAMNERDYSALEKALANGDITAQKANGKYDFVANNPAGQTVISRMDKAQKVMERRQARAKANIGTFEKYMTLAEKNDIIFDSGLRKLGLSGNETSLKKAQKILQDKGINVRKALIDDVIAATPINKQSSITPQGTPPITPYQATDPQIQQRLNNMSGIQPNMAATEAIQQMKSQPNSPKSGVLKTAEDKVLENAFRSSVKRGDYATAINIANQTGNTGVADILQNYAKFSFSDRRNRDQQQMKSRQKAVDNFIPDGYKGEASGTTEGLAEHEVQSIRADIDNKISSGLSLDQIEKEYKLLYNRFKANKSDGLTDKKKIDVLRFLKGALANVGERRRNDNRGIFGTDRQDNVAEKQGRHESGVQGSDRIGNDRSGLHGTNSEVNQKHSNQGAFSSKVERGKALAEMAKAEGIRLHYDKINSELNRGITNAIPVMEKKLKEKGINIDSLKLSFNDRRGRDKQRMRGLEKEVKGYIPEGYRGEATGVTEGLSQLEINNIESYLNQEMSKGKSLEIIVKELQIIYNRIKANKSDGTSNDLKIASMRFIKGALGYVRSKELHDGRLSQSSQSDNERFIERRDGDSVQGVSGQGSNRPGLSGVSRSQDGIDQKHSNQGAFSSKVERGKALAEMAKAQGIRLNYDKINSELNRGITNAIPVMEKKLIEKGISIDSLKLSFNDRRGRDKQRMRGLEKEVKGYIPEGYRGEATGITEGLAEHEVKSIDEYIDLELSKGKNLDVIEKQLLVGYNRIKANKSDGMDINKKIDFMKFLQGAMNRVRDKRRAFSGVHGDSGRHVERADERRIGNSFQGPDRIGNDGSGLHGTNSEVNQKHSNQGAFSTSENKPKYSLSAEEEYFSKHPDMKPFADRFQYLVSKEKLNAKEREQLDLFQYFFSDTPYENTVNEALDKVKKRVLTDEEIEKMIYAGTGQKIKLTPKGARVSPKMQRIAEFGEQMGCPVRYYSGNTDLRGFHAGGITYINYSPGIPHRWVFWHESFHWMKNNNPKLYKDMLDYFKGTNSFSKEKLDAYRDEIGRHELTDEDVMEEMLADAMPDSARRVGLMKQMGKGNPTLTEKFVAWVRNMMDRFHEFFTTPAHGFKVADKKIMVDAFTNLARDMVDSNGKRIFSITGPRQISLRRTGKPLNSILHTSTAPAYSRDSVDNKNAREDNIGKGLDDNAKDAIFKSIRALTRREIAKMQSIFKNDEKVQKLLNEENGVARQNVVKQFAQLYNVFNSPRANKRELMKRYFGKASDNASNEEIDHSFELLKNNAKEMLDYAKYTFKQTVTDNRQRSAGLLNDFNSWRDMERDWERQKQSARDEKLKHSEKGAFSTVKTKNDVQYSLNNSSATPVTRKEIQEEVNRLIVSRTGGIKDKNTIGIFNSKTNVIRTKFYGDFPTLAHEIGHYIDSQLKISGHTMELVQFAKKRFPNSEYKASELRGEGIAEFGRLLLMRPSLAEKEFPGYFKAYKEAVTKKPELAKPLDRIGEKIRQWYAQSPESRGSGSVVSEKDKPFEEKVKGITNDLYTKFVDKLDPLHKLNAAIEKELGEKLEYKDNIYERARMTESFSRGRAAMLILEKDPVTAIDTINKVTNGVKLKHKVTLRSIFDMIDEKEMSRKYPNYLKDGNFESWQKAFSVYLVARRQRELQRMTPEYHGPMTKADSEAIVSKAPDELFKAAIQYYKYNENLLVIAEDAGLISKAANKALNEKYINYAPMLRDFSDEAAIDNFFGNLGGGGIGNVSSFIKKISDTGSDRNVLDPLEVTLKNTYMVYNRAERNKVGQLFLKISAENALGKFVEKVDQTSSDSKRSIFTVMVNGEKQAYQTTPEYYGAIAGYSPDTAGIVGSLLRTTAQALRTGATISPDFILRNLIRDTIFAGISSKTGFIPIVDTIKGMRALKQNKELVAEFKAAGVPMSNFVGTNRRGAAETLDSMTGGDRGWRSLPPAKVLKSIYTLAQDTSELIESSSRMGEFMRARKQGKSIEEAGFLAKELTLDFGRSGTFGQKYNQMVPFFNACIQGGDKMFRLLRDDPKRTMAKIAMYIVMPSLALWLINHDEDWYKEMPDDIKNGSWVWKSGDTIFKIPKPQEAGVLFGSSLERLLDMVHDKNPKAMKEWALYMKDVILPNVFPTLGLPIVEWLTNYSFFASKSLVGQREQNLPDEMQYTMYTSELAKRIGSVLGLSPIKIDNTIRGYLGTAGAFVAQSMDHFFGKPYEMPSKKWSELPGIRGFTYTAYSRAKSVDEFYNIYEKITKEHNAYGKVGHPSAVVRGVRKSAEQIADLRHIIRQVAVDPKLSPERKREIMDTKNKKILEIAKRANATYGKATEK